MSRISAQALKNSSSTSAKCSVHPVEKFTLKLSASAELTSERSAVAGVPPISFSVATSASDPKGNTPAPASHMLERAEQNQPSTLVVFECRGCEFVDFEPRGSWRCKGADSGTIFEDFEFEDGRYDDWDEKAQLPISISDISARFERA
ncbi:MAG: hypothetical protein CYPHOPRED_002800 [Cyphobasidiales sp. Tagirdzhanova-0007]|nr:MAG: hypothetical protein CYPHOPRED_002800 [Cyphobasidiales sp. Tagirdzhanova-0007]